MSHESYQSILKPLISDNRFAHSLRVQEMATRLAAHYHVDREKASTAGLLHDAAKSMTPTQLQVQEFPKDTWQQETFDAYPKLWHAIVAPAVISRLFDITDADILSACQWHTTGNAEMSVLEQVIFVADAIEVGRDYPEREQFEKEAFENLESAVLSITRASLLKLIQKGGQIHPYTLACYNFYCKGV